MLWPLRLLTWLLQISTACTQATSTAPGPDPDDDDFLSHINALDANAFAHWIGYIEWCWTLDSAKHYHR